MFYQPCSERGMKKHDFCAALNNRGNRPAEIFEEKLEKIFGISCIISGEDFEFAKRLQ